MPAGGGTGEKGGGGGGGGGLVRGTILPPNRTISTSNPPLKPGLTLTWWAHLLPSRNGRGTFLDLVWTSADSLNLFEDATISHSFGALFNAGVSYHSPPPSLPHYVQWQELFAILTATCSWVGRLAGQQVAFRSLAMVHTWTGQSSWEPAPH